VLNLDSLLPTGGKSSRHITLDAFGRILKISDGIAKVYGLKQVRAGEMVLIG
jgi:F0F1-type ATP synthase alpha subunit